MCGLISKYFCVFYCFNFVDFFGLISSWSGKAHGMISIFLILVPLELRLTRLSNIENVTCAKIRMYIRCYCVSCLIYICEDHLLNAMLEFWCTFTDFVWIICPLVNMTAEAAHHYCIRVYLSL